jgi:decaprenylphospho-beta-D-erythro-pentofuranosid-2-ulose 2-reductase
MSASKFVTIIGATSDIGFATARYFAANGWNVCLVGRNETAVERNAKDIAIRTGMDVPVRTLDILNVASFDRFIEDLPALPDTVVCVVGLLGNHRLAEIDLGHASTIIRTNYEGPALLLGRFAEAFAKRKSGTIIGVSSVAGDRVRASSYIYGSAKAGLTAFLSGLRARMIQSDVHVITVKPGFVDTRMTADMRLPRALTATAEEVAAAIYDANKNKTSVIYVRRIWFLIMSVVGLLPDWFFMVIMRWYTKALMPVK